MGNLNITIKNKKFSLLISYKSITIVHKYTFFVFRLMHEFYQVQGPNINSILINNQGVSAVPASKAPKQEAVKKWAEVHAHFKKLGVIED